MDISQFTFKLLFLFFPGIICAFIVNELTTHSKIENFIFILQSFIFGLISYLLYWACLLFISTWIPSIISSFKFLNALTTSTTDFSFQEISYVTICAVVLGFFIAFLTQRKFLNWFAHQIHVTNKFGESDVWGYFMNSKEIEWVTVRDHSNNLIFDGWIKAFSDDSKNAEILLRDVSVYKNTSGIAGHEAEFIYQVGALYLSRNRQDISIECRTIPIDENIKRKEKNNV